MKRSLELILLALLATAAFSAEKPSVLIINGTGTAPSRYGDFDYFQRLNQHGFQIDVHFLDEPPPRPITADLLQKYNCLVILDLPPDEKDSENWPTSWGKVSPYKSAMLALLDAYLDKGGGIFLMPDLQDRGFRGNRKIEDYLERWGARLPYESVQDPATVTPHPRDTVPFVYTENVAKSPVSNGVKGLWFPGGDWMSYNSLPTTPLLVSKEWIEVVRGSDTSFTRNPALPWKLDQAEVPYYQARTRRPDPKVPPTLYAIREQGQGRLALAAIFPVFTLHGGTSWIHNGAVLDKGLAGRPSDFGKLFENTLRWLSEPSLKSGALGGYVQDPRQLVCPNLRKKPEEYFPQFDSCQNMTAPGNVYRGLIGARTSYSSGKGTVEEYAAAAKAAGLDFIVFMEEFGKKGGLTQEKYRKLEADCKRLSDDKLFLMPGFSFRNNIGNHQFAYGHDIKWPGPTQFVGANGDEFRHQCFDKSGNLDFSDEDAKNWFWSSIHGCTGRNIGYYNFANSPANAMPVRDLRIFGILGVMTYLKGKLAEDLTPDYLNYVRDGNPPLAGAVEIVHSPAELARAVKEKHYLTHVAAARLADLPVAMQYGHQYGRANVNPSNGPQIKSWAGAQRVLTYAGEPFVPARYRIRPLAWVTSEAGLKEVKIWDDNKVIRRLLLNGAKEFKQTFEWTYDRQRVNVLEAIDVDGCRAVSAGFESWCDANFNTWCSDRQNGMLWHGPLTMGSASNGCSPGLNPPMKSVGPTWDGGPPPPACANYNIHPGARFKANQFEGILNGVGGRLMEGDMWPTCVDESVANVAAYGDHTYAPGAVANAYHTMGPIQPSESMTFTVRRTQYLQRPAGVSRDWHPMWTERAGGNLELVEGTMTFKKDVVLEDMNVLWLQLCNFPKNGSNLPLFGIRRGNDALPLCGPPSSVWIPNGGIPTGFNTGQSGTYLLDPGGYFAVVPTGEGIASVLFNLGTGPMTAVPWGEVSFSLPVAGRSFKAGESLAWRYLVVMDGLDQPIHNLYRIERLREYYGIDGKHTSGLKVKRGKLLSHLGLVDLAPENGVVEFEVPAPDFPLQLPLGLRFIGFNPNWALGQFQISGFSMGNYTNGSNVYRSLATDDRDMAFLAVYPDVPLSRSIVGHPVQCDNPKLVIEFAQLNSKPVEYRVAVNNPTDAPIKTTLKKCMDLPGFEFPDQPIEVPAGGYVMVKEK